LCPKSAGGDGKTEDVSDCPRGSSGWWAWKDAQGDGSRAYNHVRGWVASADEALTPELPPDVIKGEFNIPIGGRITGFTRHGLNQAISRDGRGVAGWAILEAVSNPTKITQQANGAILFVGANARVVLNAAGEIVTVIATSAKAWRILP